MKRLHVIGRKNHGKTQLVVDLVEQFVARGVRVATVKHTHHQHELDTPGKDSHRHRASGAAMVGILSRNMSAVFVPRQQDGGNEDRYAVFADFFKGCDLVIVEGDTMTMAPMIEVWRASLGTDPIAAEDKSIKALVTDDPLRIDTTVHPRSDVSRLASWIQRHVWDDPL